MGRHRAGRTFSKPLARTRLPRNCSFLSVNTDSYPEWEAGKMATNHQPRQKCFLGSQVFAHLTMAWGTKLQPQPEAFPARVAWSPQSEWFCLTHWELPSQNLLFPFSPFNQLILPQICPWATISALSKGEFSLISVSPFMMAKSYTDKKRYFIYSWQESKWRFTKQFHGEALATELCNN